MYFLVDYENVKCDGMIGAEHLTRDDSILIFYSDNTPNITLDRISDILRSGCLFETCKLQTPGKNALDFYIATKTGEIFGSGSDSVVAVVSGDKGFRFIADFWNTGSQSKKVVFRPSIEECIALAERSTDRARAIAKKLEKKGAAQAGSKKSQTHEHAVIADDANTSGEDAMTRALKTALGTSYTDEIRDLVRGAVVKKQGLQEKFRAIVKQFGQQKGLEIYRGIKKTL